MPSYADLESSSAGSSPDERSSRSGVFRVTGAKYRPRTTISTSALPSPSSLRSGHNCRGCRNSAPIRVPRRPTRLARRHVERFDRKRSFPRSLVLDNRHPVALLNDTVHQMHDLYCAPLRSPTQLEAQPTARRSLPFSISKTIARELQPAPQHAHLTPFRQPHGDIGRPKPVPVEHHLELELVKHEPITRSHPSTVSAT